jgi:hypothetical protein
MYIRKVRGKNAIYPVKMTSVQVMLAKKAGVTVEQYVKAYIEMIAKQRRWKWYFERRDKNGV